MQTELQEYNKAKIHKAHELGLNLRERKFCELYSSSAEFFGNGTQTYIEVYSTPKKKVAYKTAMVCASELLRKGRISEYINYLIEMRGLNDGFVDKQLEFLITQHADFRAKLGAVHEYNQLKRRIDAGGNKTLVLVVSGESANRYGVTPTRVTEGSSN